MDPTTPPHVILSNDKNLAKISLQLLYAVSIFHIILLSIRNDDSIWYFFKAHFYDFNALLVPLIVVTLNFLPVILANRLYRKGLYKKQLGLTIITFVISQSLLHLFIISLGGAVC